MNMQILFIDIEGMTCSGCISGVRRAIGTLDGVGAAALAFQSGTATTSTCASIADPYSPPPHTRTSCVSQIRRNQRQHDAP